MSSSESAVCDSIFSSDVESGYSSSSDVDDSPETIVFTKQHLRFLNKKLSTMEPQDILRWCLTTLPNLYQTTAFGLTGLVILDMLSQISTEGPGLIFLDTLHHFPETLALVERVRARYPQTTLHIYQPENAQSESEFSSLHGAELWKTNEERYDYLAKVAPAERAYRELSVQAVLTGRRRSQGGKRGELDILEVSDTGMIKANPLAGWDFERVRAYVREHDVPYNELLDRGYKSVGDWHSTQPVRDGEDERAGRWKGREKTECGIHNKRSRYAQFLMDMERKRQQEEEAKAEVEDSGIESEASRGQEADDEEEDCTDLECVKTPTVKTFNLTVRADDKKEEANRDRADSAIDTEAPSLDAIVNAPQVSLDLVPIRLL